MKGITPLDVRHFEYFQGGECLSNAHWLGPWRQHFDDELRLYTPKSLENHRKNQEVGLLCSLFCDHGFTFWTQVLTPGPGAGCIKGV
jgi:hypothetical protein